MKKNKGKKVGLFLMIFITILGIVGLLPFLIPLKQITDTVEIELGDTLSEELSNYVSGFEPAFWVTSIDTSDVNVNEIGDYQVLVKHGFQEFVYSVFVRDTVAPTLTFKDGKIYLEKGKTYPTSYFIEESFDLDGDVFISITESHMPDTKRSYAYSTYCGKSVLTFFAVDNSGNEAVYTLDVIFDTPPEIIGIKDFYVVPGSVAKYKEGVNAIDVVDGDRTSHITINAENVDLSKKGSYTVEYSCEDSYGLVSTKTAKVNVMDAMEIQELINTHKIHRLTEKIEGAYNLYDVGYYDDKTLDEMIKIMHPTTTRITNESGYGSGFIVKIDDENIILGTNQHVVKQQSVVGVYLFDGSFAMGKVIGTNYGYDMAIVSVKVEDIKKETLDQLYTVHIDKGYWDDLDNKANLEIGLRCINDKGQVWRDRKGKLIYKEGTADLMWRDLPQVTRVSTELFHGASGSGLFDIHGNFMGIGTYIITGAGRYESYCSTVPIFCNVYEEIMKEKPYYQ